MTQKKKFTVTENRVEQWETEYGIKELGIYGAEKSGLIQALAEEVWKLRTMSLYKDTSNSCECPCKETLAKMQDDLNELKRTEKDKESSGTLNAEAVLRSHGFCNVRNSMVYEMRDDMSTKVVAQRNGKGFIVHVTQATVPNLDHYQVAFLVGRTEKVSDIISFARSFSNIINVRS